MGRNGIAAAGRPRVAAILAGGEGRRMGGVAKESMLVDGSPMGPRLVAKLSTCFERVIVVTKNGRLYEGTGAMTVSDIVPGFGPLSGLHAALSATIGTGSDRDRLWLSACDMPFFDERLVDLLAVSLDGASDRARTDGSPEPLACLARYGTHFEPFHGIYSVRLLEPLEKLFEESRPNATPRDTAEEGDRVFKRPSFKDLFARAPAAFVPEDEVRSISPDWGLFFNINTPAELDRLGPT